MGSEPVYSTQPLGKVASSHHPHFQPHALSPAAVTALAEDSSTAEAPLPLHEFIFTNLNVVS